MDNCYSLSFYVLSLLFFLIHYTVPLCNYFFQLHEYTATSIRTDIIGTSQQEYQG